MFGLFAYVGMIVDDILFDWAADREIRRRERLGIVDTVDDNMWHWTRRRYPPHRDVLIAEARGKADNAQLLAEDLRAHGIDPLRVDWFRAHYGPLFDVRSPFNRKP